MRSNTEIKRLILEIVQKDDRIRAVLLNGSRADAYVTPDKYQDFDVVFIVQAIEDFSVNHNWIHVFGELIIKQLPDEMIIGERSQDSFGYLMLFKDGNRIDLTLYPIDLVRPNFWPDSLTICWLDKDGLFPNLPEPSTADYQIKVPALQEFTDTCNEFWWVSTYVVKGLARRQIPYAKEMMETVVRPMFMKMISWQIGTITEFSEPFGKSGKYISKFLGEDFYERVLATYANADLKENWQALSNMAEIFAWLSVAVGEKLRFPTDTGEIQRTHQYIKQQREMHAI
ncbi:aminoglycoside 6-adenylyltransferase [Dyadobacter soli]|uniref:Aminoglycoside 6-adenylyltransferase n=1 Tax=Dyadobacter soli TaxID=659014 RepID=A0A1G7MDG3_9BACT|nr:aminoglycoside 6-adenylyltransferase [Dyadobacter soli]SDF59705.1 aminoglycoside 6-adenylyltransferase [Dyadobacter soli]